MDGRSYLVGTILGAAAGAAVGYLWSTRGDRFSLERARHVIDNVTSELQHAQTLWMKVRSALDNYQDERRRTHRLSVFDVVDFDSQAGAR